MSKATRVVVDGVSYPLDDTTAVDFSEAQSLSTAEKQQARTNIGAGSAADVTSIQTAIGTVPSGSNLQGEVDDLKSSLDDFFGIDYIAFTKGYYIDVTTDPVSLTPITSGSGYSYAILPCEAGDKFTITGTGGNSAKLWTFVNSQNNRISWSVPYEAATRKVITAPTNSAKVIFNVDSNGGEFYQGDPLYYDDLIKRVDYIDDKTNESLNPYIYDGLGKGSSSVSTQNYSLYILEDLLEPSYVINKLYVSLSSATTYHVFIIDENWNIVSVMEHTGVSGQNEITITSYDTKGKRYRIAFEREYLKYATGIQPLIGFNTTGSRESFPVVGEKIQPVSFYSQALFDVKIIAYNNINKFIESTLYSINPWQNGKWYAFGTSISNYMTGKEGQFPPFLENLSGLTFCNYAYSGGCIANYGSVAKSQILDMIDATTITNAKLVTVEGFVNDWAQGVPIGNITDTTNATLCGAIYQAYIKLLAKTNATIVFITDSTGKHYIAEGININLERDQLINGKTQNDFIQATIEMCKYLGVPVIDAGRKSGISQDTGDLYIIDQIHHTVKGGEQYANAIWAELKDIKPRII